MGPGVAYQYMQTVWHSAVVQTKLTLSLASNYVYDDVILFLFVNDASWLCWASPYMSGVSVMFQITGNSFSVSVMRWSFLVLPFSFFFLNWCYKPPDKTVAIRIYEKKTTMTLGLSWLSVMRKLWCFCTCKLARENSHVVLQAVGTDVFLLKTKELWDWGTYSFHFANLSNLLIFIREQKAYFLCFLKLQLVMWVFLALSLEE